MLKLKIKTMQKIVKNYLGKKTGEQNLIIFRFNSPIQRIAEAPWKIMTDFVWKTEKDHRNQTNSMDIDKERQKPPQSSFLAKSHIQ